MSFLDRIHVANTHNPAHFRAFQVAGTRVGFINHAFAEILVDWPQTFRVAADKVTLAPDLDRPDTPLETRNSAVNDVLIQLRNSGLITSWRDELYAASPSYTEQPSLLIERAAIPFFGGVRLWRSYERFCA